MTLHILRLQVKCQQSTGMKFQFVKKKSLLRIKNKKTLSIGT